MITGTVSYKDSATPSGYQCNECGISGVKLWREYQTVDPQLLCCVCAAKDQNKNIDDIDEGGCYTTKDDSRSDQIGWYVPAVPDEEGQGFWGYTSVPNDGVKWWKELPTGFRHVAEEESNSPVVI